MAAVRFPTRIGGEPDGWIGRKSLHGELSLSRERGKNLR